MSHFYISPLATLLSQAAVEHHEAEKRLPEHNWAVWYAAFIHQRQSGDDAPTAVAWADEFVRNELKFGDPEARPVRNVRLDDLWPADTSARAALASLDALTASATVKTIDHAEIAVDAQLIRCVGDC